MDINGCQWASMDIMVSSTAGASGSSADGGSSAEASSPMADSSASGSSDGDEAGRDTEDIVEDTGGIPRIILSPTCWMHLDQLSSMIS